MQRIALIWAISLALLAALPAGAKSKVAPSPPPPPMCPEMHARIAEHMQDLLVMMHNTAVTTPQGMLVVLQGNRLLIYGVDLTLQHTVVLPTPMMPATPLPPAPSLISQIPSKILPTADGGLLVVRGQQVIRLDATFTVTGSVMLPDLPPMSSADLVAASPLSWYLQMFMSRRHMWQGHRGMRGERMMPPEPDRMAPPME